METHAIVKIEADPSAQEQSIVQQFNSYMQNSQSSLSFVSGSEGYFRVSCTDSAISSAAIEPFGNFLEKTGYCINNISTAQAKEGEQGTFVSFEKQGQHASVVLSTLRIY